MKLVFQALVLSAILSAGISANATECNDVAQATQAIVEFANSPYSPFKGTQYTAADFPKVAEYQGLCRWMPGYDDCAEPSIEAVFQLETSFEPGARGWVAVSRTCEIDWSYTFQD